MRARLPPDDRTRGRTPIWGDPTPRFAVAAGYFRLYGVSASGRLLRSFPSKR